MAGSKEKTVEDCIKLIEDLIEIAANTTECTCETWGPFHNNHCPTRNVWLNIKTSIAVKINKVFKVKHSRCEHHSLDGWGKQCFNNEGHDGSHRF